MMTSKGIIIVARIIMKTKYLPLKWYLARPKPVSAERITVVMVTAEATMSEFRIFLRYMKLPSFPLIPCQ